MKDDSLHPWIEPELEARIVALVVGEASDFETEELERLIEEKSELGLFHQRMAALHGMLRANGKTESISDAGGWKLSEERRETVVAVLGGSGVEFSKAKIEEVSTEATRRNLLPMLLKIAAAVAVLAALAGLMMPASVGMRSAERDSLIADDLIMTDLPVHVSYREKAKDVDGNVLSSLDTGLDEFVADAVPRIVGGGEAVANRDRRYAQIGHGALNGTVALGSGGEILLNQAGDGYHAKGQVSGEVVVGEPVIAMGAGGPIEVRPTGDSSIEVVAATPLSGSGRMAGDTVPVITGHGGMSADGAVPRQSRVDESRITVTAGAQVELLRDGEAAADSIVDSYSIAAANGQQNNERARMNYYDSAYKHTRSKMLHEVPAGWESPVPQGLERDEENSHSLEKLPAVSDPSKNEGQYLGFDEKSKDSDLNFPQEPTAPVVSTGSIRGDKVWGGVSDLSLNTAIAAGGVAFQEKDGISAGSANDYALVNPRDSEEKKMRNKQHGGTVPISGGIAEAKVAESDVLQLGVRLSADFGDEESEIEESDAIKLETKADSSRFGRISIKENNKTKDGVVRRELPAIVEKPISAVEVATRGGRIRVGGGFAGVDPSGNDSNQAGLRSGAAALDGDAIDALIRAASFQKTPADLTELSAQEKPFSTFSLHVSDVSFKLAQAALAKGEWPDAERIRIEEFVNAFDYGDPLPSQEEKVAANLEQAIHPFLQQRNLLRVSMRTAATGRNSTTPLRLTFLLDNSGSMERMDRKETVQKAFALLASMLHPSDQVTLISFARQPRLIADRVSGDQTAGLIETVKNLPSEGGTNLEAALALAFEKAKEQQLPGAQNRIILLTDGAANLGDAEPQRLAAKVEQMRNGGIAFDAAGIGTEGLNDEILEALTRKGDGRYYLLDEADDVDAGFAKQIAGALRPAAGNVKVQIEFNPERVGKYKLLGFEKHRLKKEDFRNDKVDAAELAAAEAGVAVYQVETKPDGKGDVGSAFVRFRDMATGEMLERRWSIPYQSHPSRPVTAAPSMQVATVAAMLGAKLKGDVLGDVVDLDELLQIVSGLPESWKEKSRVGELKAMLESARAIAGN